MGGENRWKGKKKGKIKKMRKRKVGELLPQISKAQTVGTRPTKK